MATWMRDNDEIDIDLHVDIDVISSAWGCVRRRADLLVPIGLGRLVMI
jgi:hypothetical protein